MTLHQLKVVEAVVRYRNLTKASSELHVSQPACSQQLKLLEAEFGKTLFLRNRRGMELTREGRAFVDAMKPVLTEITRFETTFKAPQNTSDFLSISVGGSASIGPSLMPPLLASFGKIHPKIRFVLETNNSQVLEHRILKSELDIAVITRPSYSPFLAYEIYKQHKAIAFVSPTYSLLRRSATLAELAKCPLVLRLRSTILSTLLKRGFSPKIAVECENPEAVRAAVYSGMGVGILREEAVQHDFVTGVAKKLWVPELEKLEVYSYIVFDRRKTLAPLAQEFLDFLRESRESNNPRLSDMKRSKIVGC